MNSPTLVSGNRPSSATKGSLLIIFLTIFIDLLGFGIVIPLLPIYADQFGVDQSGLQLGLLMASFSAMQFLFSPFWGRLSDRIGRRPVLMIGLAGSTIFYLLFGIATIYKSISLLLVARIGAGIAGATIATAQAYIADSTSLERRPKGMAMIGMAFGLGFTFGPLLGFLAVPTGHGDPGPLPGYVAAGLSAVSLALAVFLLPESRSDADPKTRRRIFDFEAFGTALAIPSVGLLLLAVFVCVFSFSNFETTLSLLIKGRRDAPGPFNFTWRSVCLTYAFIGFTLALVQGGIVRRLAGRVSEGVLAGLGAAGLIAGFGMVVAAIALESVGALFGALTIVVAGFSFMQPNLNSLISRRSDPAKQGMILGVNQSVSSLARILGSGLSMPLFMRHANLPYYVALVLMVIGLLTVIAAARRGRDFQSTAEPVAR